MAVGKCSDTASIALSHIRARVIPDADFLTFLSTFFLFLLILGASLFTTPASAQNSKPGIVGLGDLVVTGASGTLPPPPNPPLPPGVNQLDETFIDPNGASLKVFDVANPGGPPQAQLLNAPAKFQAFARDIGQVFGLALDKADPPNIFAASTSVHGLQIVIPDADGDGRPERIKLGQPGAQWMDGQFGEALGGGPGTVWKINGETGEITKFADILSGGVPNSGPGLGNIAYDAKHKQLFVSDLDTGLIHGFDMTGTELGTFDHGLQGRPANGMNAVPDDPANRADISSPAFDAEDSGSWGMTAPERRVWGLAVRGGRLYYSVEDGPQIWSVGINQDGGFGGNPRWELDVPDDPNAYPVSDIAFTGSGDMLLAQRGGIASRYDYSQYQTPRKTRVLRYSLESPDDAASPSRWVEEPDDYAIGFPGTHRNSSGGIAIGYGYKKKPDGSYGLGSCEGTLWSTGDALRDNPVFGAKLAQGGPLNVHGLQGNALGLDRPQNVPPWESYYVDFDGQFDDPQASGHVGDVEIARVCARKRVDLRILKKARSERCTAGNSCPYEIEITNVGSLPYNGPLVIHESADGGAKLVSAPPPGWDCQEQFPGVYECKYPSVTLAPGEKISLELTFQLPPWWDRYVYKNCAELRVPGFDKDIIRYNNRSCDYVPTVPPGHAHYKPDLQIEKYIGYGNCAVGGLCHFIFRIINVGAGVYAGPLNIHDVVSQPGSAFTGWDPQPEWTCGPLGGNAVDCSRGPVTLGPGDFREVHVYFNGPPLGLGFTHVRNCASIDWKGAPGDINPFNEYACAEVSLFPPGHPDARPQLKIEKDDLGQCADGAGPGGGWLCRYTITVTNSGGAPYLDPIVVTDTTAIMGGPAASTLADFQNNPPWVCAPGAGAAGTQTCTYPPLPGGLQPGESKTLDLEIEWPAGIAKPNAVQNCSMISHDNDGDGVAEEFEDCAVTFICTPGPAGDCPDDLVLTKVVQDGPCWPGFPCQFTVNLANPGPNAFPAGLVVTDVPNPDAGAMTVTSPGPGTVACVPAGANHTCTVLVAIPAGCGGICSIVFDLDVPPAYPWTTLKNCASIPSGVPGNDFNFNDENCAIAFIPGPDLAPYSDTECKLGEPACKLPASIDNKGQRDFKGSAGVKGTLSPALQITGIISQTPGFTCAKTGFSAYECKGDRLTIKAGGAVKYELTVSVPANYPHAKVNHIKSMVWPNSKEKDRNPENDQHTSIITIKQPKKPPPPPAGKPDLAISKTANQNACAAGTGSNCGFTVRVTSAGTAPYSGKIVVSDIITPANARLTGSGPAPWVCSRTHGSLNCTYPNTTMAPGQSKTLSLNFALLRNARGVVNNCATLKWGTTQTRGSVRDVQSALTALGYNPGPADGKMGGNTRNAIRALQSAKGLQPTGQINPALLNVLFGGPAGGGDANPANNRACAASSIIAQAPPPPPQQCTGGQFRNNKGICRCPSNKPVWTGQRCIAPPPQQCFGGKVRNHQGVCACPSSKPIWTGQQCIARVAPPPPPQCTGGRTPKYVGGRLICSCPSSKPIWNGQFCIAKPPVSSCPSGYSRVEPIKAAILAAQGWKIKTVGNTICAKKPGPKCKGGQYYDKNKKSCRCPSNKPIWTGRSCISQPPPSCPGGKIYSNTKKTCVCPSHKPYWNGQQCTQTPSHGGGQTTVPGGQSEIGCSGGRKRDNKGNCRCPSRKPIWTGRSCVQRPQIKPQQGPILKLPGGGTFKIPGIKIQ